MPRGAQRIKGSSDERLQARNRLRAALITAARDLAEDAGGYEAVTIRQVADRVGYAAPVVYQYFANKHDLLVAVITTGFAELAERLRRAACPTVTVAAGGPLQAVAETWWSFAADNRRLYELMHSLTEVPFGTPQTPSAARDCFYLLKAAVAAAAPQHLARVVDEDAATDLFWAHLHGLTTLALNARIKGGNPRARVLLQHLTAAFVTAQTTS